MPVTLVTDPADVVMDPDVWPWTTRLKYTRVEELLFDYEAANAAIGRQHCPVSDYFRAHLDDDILEVEAYCYGHEEWGPTTLVESLYQTLHFNYEGAGPNGAFIARWAQHYLLLTLNRLHPYERARGPFEAMLKHPRMRFVSPAAAYVAVAYLNQGHPNPRRFLEKYDGDVTGRHFPGLPVERFAAPAFDAAATG